MGSFNVACSVSNISISPGMPCAYLPLKPSTEGNKISNNRDFLISTTCYYAPYTLPIFGEYNDYGRLNIETDKNVIFLEEKFGIKIEDIFDKDKFPSQGMFIHKDIWDIMVKKQMNEFGEIVKDKKSNKGYYGNYGDEYYKKQFDLLKDYLILEEEINNKLKDKSISSVERAELAIKGARMARDPKIEYNIFRFPFYSIFIGKDLDKNFNINNIDSGLYNVYKEKIREGDFFEELLALKKFEISMHNCNNFYFPAMNGSQFGNPDAHKIIVEKTLEILNEDIEDKTEYWEKI